MTGWGRRTISHVTARSRTFIIYTYALGVSGFIQVDVIIMSSETLSDYPGRESEFAKSLFEKKKKKTNRFQTITVIQAYFKAYKSDKWSYLHFLQSNRSAIIKLEPFSTDWKGLNGTWYKRFILEAKTMPEWKDSNEKVTIYWRVHVTLLIRIVNGCRGSYQISE